MHQAICHFFSKTLSLNDFSKTMYLLLHYRRWFIPKVHIKIYNWYMIYIALFRPNLITMIPGIWNKSWAYPKAIDSKSSDFYFTGLTPTHANCMTTTNTMTKNVSAPWGKSVTKRGKETPLRQFDVWMLLIGDHLIISTYYYRNSLNLDCDMHINLWNT